VSVLLLRPRHSQTRNGEHHNASNGATLSVALVESFYPKAEWAILASFALGIT
jgi:hypothetical protein